MTPPLQHPYGVKKFDDGEPGDCFLFVADHGDWAIWKHLDGDSLAAAHELGYDGPMVCCMLIGRGGYGELPANPKTDLDDLPWAMDRLAKVAAQIGNEPHQFIGKLA